MKRSEINELTRQAAACLAKQGWVLPPNATYEVTDFGLGDTSKAALVEVCLAAWPEYCEKIMYARRGQCTPTHFHKQKKEDIICRWGELEVKVWPSDPRRPFAPTVTVPLNNQLTTLESGKPFMLPAGHRVTMCQNVVHEFTPISAECIIGEVSMAIDELHDNFFIDPAIDLFKPVEEDM